MTTVQDRKWEWFKAAVQRIKREQKLTQRDIAERMEETEQELSGRLSEKTRRSIPDDYLDRFAEKFGFAFGENQGQAIGPELVEVLKEVRDQGNRSTNTIDLLVEQVKLLRQQLREKNTAQ